MIEAATRQQRCGYTMLKVYLGRGALEEELRRLTAVRAAVGTSVAFMVDVNGRWTVDECLYALPRMTELGVTLLEQPIAKADEPGQAEVCRRSTIDIMADESVYSAADVSRLVRLRAASVANIGISKLGGLLRARECEGVARASGWRVAVGSVLEMGVATAAGLHLAAAVVDLPYPAYLTGPLKYDRDITSLDMRVYDGTLSVPNGPGLGVEVCLD
jgi:L-alanine-DL-glutamate epimerase-like enolase superfamily enzyme